MENSIIYDETYYKQYDEGGYERGGIWQRTFENIADRIVKEINPRSVLDVGCAKGFLVEALRDRGVEAYGVDISDYAISQVREDLKPYFKVGSATEELDRDYDLIVCIEVLEHLSTIDSQKAVENFCKHSSEVLFSSTPNDFQDDTHINVQPVEFWAEQFYYNGFTHVIDYDAHYISSQTMRFIKNKIKTIELIKMYERNYFIKNLENISLHDAINIANERIRVLDENNIKNGQIIDKTKIKDEEIDKLKEEIDKLNKEIQIRDKKIEEKEITRQRARKDMAEARTLVKQYEEKYYVEQDIRKFLENELFKYKTLADERLNMVNGIYNSRSWKFGKPIRFMGRVVRKIKRIFV